MTQTSEVSLAPATANVTVTSEVTVTSPALTPETAPATEIAPNAIPDWEMGCYKADMCMGLEVVNGAERYQELANAFVASYENREWIASMGIKDVDGFMKFLEKSEHLDPITGKMRKGWIPLIAQDGRSKFMLLQGGNNGGYGLFDAKNLAIVEAGGFFFDHIGFVAASKAEMDANVGGVADWMQRMWEQNGRNVLVRSGSLGIEQWGLAVVDGQLVFVGLNNGVPLDNYPQKDRLLGQPDPKKNGQILSAYYELYTRVYLLYANNKARDALDNYKIFPNDPDKWLPSPQLCVAGTSGSCEGKSPSNFASDPLFVPAE